MDEEGRGDRLGSAALAAAMTAAAYAGYLVGTSAAGVPQAWADAGAVLLLLFAAAGGGFVVRTWWYGPAAGATLTAGLLAVGLVVELFGAADLLWEPYLGYAANVGNLCILGGLLGWAARLTDERLREMSG